VLALALPGFIRSPPNGACDSAVLSTVEAASRPCSRCHACSFVAERLLSASDRLRAAARCLPVAAAAVTCKAKLSKMSATTTTTSADALAALAATSAAIAAIAAALTASLWSKVDCLCSNFLAAALWGGD
jgi:hypothetical protein